MLQVILSYILQTSCR